MSDTEVPGADVSTASGRRPVVVVLVALAVVAAGVAAFSLRGGDDAEELGAFDPDGLDWRTFLDPDRAYSIDLPGEPEAAPARFSGIDDALAVRGPVIVAVASRAARPADTLIGSEQFARGVAPNLEESFGLGDVVVHDTTVGGDGAVESLSAEFDAVVEEAGPLRGTPVSGVMEIRLGDTQGVVVLVMGARGERVDVLEVHGRMMTSLRSPA